MAQWRWRLLGRKTARRKQLSTRQMCGRAAAQLRRPGMLSAEMIATLHRPDRRQQIWSPGARAPRLKRHWTHTTLRIESPDCEAAPVETSPNGPANCRQPVQAVHQFLLKFN